MSPKNCRRNLLRVATGIALASLLTACATGPAFTGVEPPPHGHGVVYLYRLSAFVQGGNIYSIAMSPGAETLKLRNAGWLKVNLPPDVYRLGAVDQFGYLRCRPMLLDVQAGHILFVKLSVDLRTVAADRFAHSCHLSQVPAESALPEITGLARSDELPPSPQKTH
jgi:hypothetical protein